MRTRVCDLLGTEFPIVAFSHCRDVVIAVSKAGGLGVLGAVELSAEELDRELASIEAELGDIPYGVDIVIPSKYVGRDESDLDLGSLQALVPEQHRQFVASLLESHHVGALPPDVEPATGMISWSQSGAAPLLDAALAHRPRLLANALGSPPTDVVERAHGQGLVVAALAGSARHAARHVEAGVDLVVAQGYEAGGHTGEITTMVLVPEVVEAVAPTPVLAAGGIARGRQVAAAMALGAEGVWTGSVWLTTREAETHPSVKREFLAATSGDTLRSRSLTGKPARQLRTGWTEAWDDPDAPDPLPMPLQTILIAQARQRVIRAVDAGNDRAEPLMTGVIGQVVGLLDAERPAAGVVFDMVDEYLTTVGALHDGLDDPERARR